MCTGAIINSRIRRVFIGAMDPKEGAMGSVVDLTSFPFNHKPEIHTGLLADESQSLLKEFFRNLRKQKQRTE
jgi:tRNA(adenine34) deaminase